MVLWGWSFPFQCEHNTNFDSVINKELSGSDKQGKFIKSFSPCAFRDICVVHSCYGTLAVSDPKMQTAWKKRKLVLKKNHSTAEKSWGFPKYLFLLLIIKTFGVTIASLMKTMAKSQMITVALNKVIWWENS